MNNIVTSTAEIEQNTNPALPTASVIQQRQILALMGIDLWAQRDLQTVNVNYDEVYENLGQEPNSFYSEQSGGLVAAPTISDSTQQNHQGNQPNEQSPVDTQGDTHHNRSSEQNVNSAQALAGEHQNPNIPSNLTSLGPDPIGALKRSVDIQDKAANAPAPVRHQEMSLEQVDPFEVMGVRYKEWVILADVAQLRETQSLQLWENILLGLSVTAQSQKFPICDGITDKETANASVAGFIFKLAQSDCQKIIAITPLPECLEINSIIQGPYLSDMIENGDNKKVLWQKVNSSND